MKRSFSGIQPTGDLHIGNYLGAIKTWVDMLDRYECFFCIVDLHALTIKYDTSLMAQRTLDAVAVNMACGLDPKKCTIFIQSHVKEHAELCWILDSVTPMGELGRMTQFKEKSKSHPENVNVGLFNYPVLQAADILLYKGEVVPVGDDQVQHIEFSREVARKFNAAYGPVFPECQALLSNAPREQDEQEPREPHCDRRPGGRDPEEAGDREDRSGQTTPHRPGRAGQVQHLLTAPVLLDARADAVGRGGLPERRNRVPGLQGRSRGQHHRRPDAHPGALHGAEGGHGHRPAGGSGWRGARAEHRLGGNGRGQRRLGFVYRITAR